MVPIVSVLMTAYNREKYIGEAIESVLASSYQSWELIIVDDRSIDKTVEIARKYEAKEPRIRVLVNEQNLGDYPNRNKAAGYARGIYLKYVDADDLIYPYGLEQLVYYMNQFPEAGYGLCSLPQDDRKIFPFQLDSKDAYQRHYFQTALFHKAPLSSIIRRNAFEKVGGFSTKRMVGDFETWHKLSSHFPVVLMPHGIVWYRKHDDQEMADYRNYLIDYIRVSESMLQSGDCPLDTAEVKVILKKLRNYKLSQIAKLSSRLRLVDCIQLIKSL